MRIIAQSQFDVNEENVAGAVLVGSGTGNGRLLSRRISGLVSASEKCSLGRDLPGVQFLRAVPISCYWYERSLILTADLFHVSADEFP